MKTLFNEKLPHSVDELMSKLQVTNAELDEGAVCRARFSNNGYGISLALQGSIKQYVDKIYRGDFNQANEATLLKLIEFLTLFSNHLDQHIKGDIPILTKEDKEREVLRWLEAAEIIAEKIIPMNSLLDKKSLPELVNAKPEALSTLAMMLHYLGKARRYNPLITDEQRLPLLETAYRIAKSNLPADKDPQYFKSRAATYELALLRCYRDLSMLDEVIEILKSQLKTSFADNQNYYHLIQSNVQLSEIYLQLFKKTNTGIHESVQFAKDALECIHNTKHIEDFSENALYFNASVALMNAYSAASEPDKALAIANGMLERYEENSNCGIKEHHLKAIEEVKPNTSGLNI